MTGRIRSNEFEAICFAATVGATLDPFNLTRRFALLPQDLFILSGSIAENICFVRPETSLDAGGQAATKAAADCFTAHRHEKNTHMIGERGVTSQWANASASLLRAIVKDTTALMLGKATSALHAESERLGRQTLDRITDHRTTIVIAHRLATAQRRTVFLKKRPRRRPVAFGAHARHLDALFAALQFNRHHGDGRQSRLAECTGTAVSFRKGPRQGHI